MPKKKAALKPRKSPKQRRSGFMVGTFLEAVARVLETKALDAISTNEIARIAGASIGSLYQYFPNKQSLVSALIDHQLDRNFRAIEAELKSHERKAPIEALEEMVDHMTELFLRRSGFFVRLFENAPALDRTRAIVGGRKRGVSLAEGWLARHARKLELKGDPSLHAFILVNSVMGCLQIAALEQPKASRKELAAALKRLVRGYLRANP